MKMVNFKTLIAFLAFAFLLSCQEPTVVTSTNTKQPGNVSAARSDVSTWPGVFDPTHVLSLYLRMDPADWDVVRFDATNSIEKPAYFKADGEEEITVAVRRKSSRALPSEADPWKIGMKVSFTRYTSSQRWHGLTKLSLENGSDVGPVAEGVAWNLHELASTDVLHPGLASWVKLYLVTGDDEPKYLGVYINVEQRDKQFLRNRDLPYSTGQVWLYEADDINAYEFEVGDLPHSPTFTALCFSPFQVLGGKKSPRGGCTQPTDTELKAILDEKIDMHSMLTQGAIDAITSNPDAMFSHGKNFRFVDFADGRPRKHFPWDLDAVFGRTDQGIYGTIGSRNKVTQTEYQRIILNHPQYRQQYNTIMLSLLDGPLNPGTLATAFDSWKAAVGPALDEDPYARVGQSHIEFDDLKNWMISRATNIRSQVQKNNLPAPRQ
jgi:spore coat protein CotH